MDGGLLSLPTIEPASPTIGYDRLCAPSVLVIGDDPARRRRLGALVLQGRARMLGETDIAGAPGRLEAQSFERVLLDLRDDGGDSLDLLLSRLDAGRPGATVVVAASAMIDIVSRWPTLSSGVLVDPDDDEIVAVAASFSGPAVDPKVNDGGIEGQGRNLRTIGHELGKIAQTLAALSTSMEGGPAATVQRAGAGARASAARAEVRQRRLRGQFFDPDLFADPAWDMLLDLAAASNERQRVAVSSLCIAAAVPPTTALRWISQMTEQGLLVREPDAEDRRRVFIALSETARTAMDRYLDATVSIRD